MNRHMNAFFPVIYDFALKQVICWLTTALTSSIPESTNILVVQTQQARFDPSILRS